MNGLMKVALYARVSSQRQAEEKTIQSQCAAIRERIEKDGLLIADEMMFCDEGYSGSELLRPALERLRDRMAASLVDRLYIHTPDRLARKYAHQALLLEEFGKHKCQVIFGDHAGLVESPETNLLVQMQGVIAEYEREKILERTRRGRRHSAQLGHVSVFAGAPYGYRYIRKSPDYPNARWEIDELESQHVRLMYQLVGEQRSSLADVCRELLRRNIKPCNGGSRWSTSSVRDILIRSDYYGDAYYGEQRLVPRKPGKRSKRGDPEVPRKAKVCEDTERKDQILIPVPAIISRSLFEEVAKVMQENRKRQRERRAGAQHLLSGLLICGCCGSAYCGHRSRQKSNSSYYRCVKNDKHYITGGQKCENTSIKGWDLEEHVWNDVCDLLQDPKRLRIELQRRQSDTGGSEKEVNELQRRVAHVRGRLDRLIDAYESGLIDKREFESRIAPLRDEHDRELAALNSLRGKLHETSDPASAETLLEHLSAEVGQNLAEASFELKRNIVKLLIRRIEIHRNEVRIVYRIPQDPFVRRPDNRGVLLHWLLRATILAG